MNDVFLAVGCLILGMSIGILIGFFCGESEGYGEGFIAGIERPPTFIVLERKGKKS